MDKAQKKCLLENAKEIQKLINDYEELKQIPNCNPYSILSRSYFVLTYEVYDDEHATSLGI
jgi:hypothetical protein